MRRGRGATAIRVLVAAGTIAAVLVPAWSAPARTITAPVTLARSITSAATGGRAGLDFAPTHVAFSWRGSDGTGVAFRTVGTGVGRSAWQVAPENHDAERADRHFSGVIAVDRPDALRWRKITPQGSWMGPVTIDYINALDGPRATFKVPATAGAAARTPDIVTRAEWGADESLKRTSGGCRRDFYPVQQFFVHHTAGSNFDPRPAATMRAIYWFHTQRQGWCDIGYNFVVGPDGRIFEGRWARDYKPWEIHSSENRSGEAVAGAHVAGFNFGSVGVALMGNFMRVAPPPDARRALAELLAWEVDRHDIAPLGAHRYRNPETGARKRLMNISGHRDAGQTSCPGNVFYGDLGAVRNDVAAIMGAGKESSDIVLSAKPRRAVYGDAVTLSGTVSTDAGGAVAREDVTIYKRPAGRSWRRGPVVTTGPDGSFSAALNPRRTTRFIAVFDGDSQTWGSQSATVRVKIRHFVSLAPQGAVQDPTGVYRFPAPPSSVTLSGNIVPRHAGARVTVRVFRQRENGTFELLVLKRISANSDRTYAYTFAVRRAGTYRATAWYPGDDVHAAGTSGPVHFVVD